MTFERDEVFGCLRAIGKADKDGYVYHGRSRAHIVAWEAANGPRPFDPVSSEALQLDHWCRITSCCALHHLEPVTRRENQLRKSWSYRCAIKRCAKGHSMENALVTSAMGRLCRTCDAEARQPGSRGAGTPL